MATTGGKRPGAGRPKKPVAAPKAVHTRIKTATSQGKKELTERLMDTVLSLKVTPLEVTLQTMGLFYHTGQKLLDQMDKEEDADKKSYLLRMAQDQMIESSEQAMQLAPYLHPKLQAVTLKGDDKNPLALGVSLRGLTNAELLTMEMLLSKAADRQEGD